MWDRIGRYYPESPRLLDVGAGQGWAIEFLLKRFPAPEAVAIEQLKQSQDYIQNKLGARVLDMDIGDDWPEEDQDSYDLVIFRHSLEHIWDPLKVLRRLAGSAGLLPVQLDASTGEIWAMFKRGEPVTDPQIRSHQRAGLLAPPAVAVGAQIGTWADIKCCAQVISSEVCVMCGRR